MSRWAYVEPEPLEIPPCPHPIVKKRIKTASNGATHLVGQCQACGSTTGGPFSKNGTKAPAYDEGLWKRYRDRCQGAREGDQKGRTENFRAWYAEYLDSQEWADKRFLVLDRDLHRCQGCWGEAEIVHHITYRHVGHEPLYDLVTLCRACHDVEHKCPCGGGR